LERSLDSTAIRWLLLQATCRGRPTRRRKNCTRASTGPAVTEAIANIHLVAVDIRRRDGRRERKKDKVHG
jgi:hypothetical protein